jgi:hypothetical protein
MNILRFLAIMLTALSLSAAFAHLLEMPAKLKYDGALWLNLLQTLYPTFGRVSGVCERSGRLSLLGACCCYPQAPESVSLDVAGRIISCRERAPS